MPYRLFVYLLNCLIESFNIIKFLQESVSSTLRFLDSVTLTFFILFTALYKFLSVEGVTIRKLPLLPNLSWNNFKIPATSFVLGAFSSMLSTTITLLLFAFSLNATTNALRDIFLLIFFLKLISFVGPNVTPPPFHMGDRIEPCLALPVPFCRHGFLPPPLTSALVFA